MGLLRKIFSAGAGLALLSAFLSLPVFGGGQPEVTLKTPQTAVVARGGVAYITVVDPEHSGGPGSGGGVGGGGGTGGGGGSGANTALSNLSAVAINTSLLPGSASSTDLGSASFPWRTIFVGGVQTPTTGVAGLLSLGQGTAPSLGANSVNIYSPTSVQAAGWGWLLPGTENASAGVLNFSAVASHITTLSVVGYSSIFGLGSPLTTEGDTLIYTSSANARLGVGANNTVLTSNGTDPLWGAVTPSMTTNPTGTGSTFVLQNQPTINAFSLTQYAGLASPAAPTAATSTASGSLAAGTYYYACYTDNTVGITGWTISLSAVLGSTGKVTVTCPTVTGASRYTFLGRASSVSPSYMQTCTGAGLPVANCTSASVFVDDGTVTPVTNAVGTSTYNTTIGIGFGPPSGSPSGAQTNPTFNDTFLYRSGPGLLGLMEAGSSDTVGFVFSRATTQAALKFSGNSNTWNLSPENGSNGSFSMGGMAISTTGSSSAGSFKSAVNCQSTGGTCTSAAAGMVTIAASATSVTVSTSAVTANSEVLVTRDDSLGTALSVTCDTQSSLVIGTPRVTARTGGTSFTISVDVAPTTNPVCISYSLIN